MGVPFTLNPDRAYSAPSGRDKAGPRCSAGWNGTATSAVVAVPAPDEVGVTFDLAVCLMILLFFAAAVGFWIAAWVSRGKPYSTLLFGYCALFGAGGFLFLILWRIATPH